MKTKPLRTFTLKRTVKLYEHCKVEAKDFDAALAIWFDDPEGLYWEDSQLGSDYEITSVEDDKGQERDVDADGRF